MYAICVCLRAQIGVRVIWLTTQSAHEIIILAGLVEHAIEYVALFVGIERMLLYVR